MRTFKMLLRWVWFLVLLQVSACSERADKKENQDSLAVKAVDRVPTLESLRDLASSRMASDLVHSKELFRNILEKIKNERKSATTADKLQRLRDLEQQSCIFLGMISTAQLDYHAARLWFDRAEHIITANQANEQVNNGNLFTLHLGQGDLDSALLSFGSAKRHFERALSLTPISDGHRRMVVLSKLSYVCSAIGESESGLRFAEQALRLAEDPRDQAKIHADLCKAYTRATNFAAARWIGLKALQLEERLGLSNSVAIASVCNDLGVVSDHLNGPEVAFNYFDRAFRLLDTTTSSRRLPLTSSVAGNLAEVLIRLGRSEEAVGYARQRIEFLEDLWEHVLDSSPVQAQAEFVRQSSPIDLAASLAHWDRNLLVEVLLHHQGLLLDSQIQRRRLELAVAEGPNRGIAAQLDRAQEQLRSYWMSGAPQQQFEAIQREIRGLKIRMGLSSSQIDRLHRSLHMDIEEVQRAIPESGVLIDFVNYSTRANTKARRSMYGALLMFRSSTRWIELGDAEDLNVEIAKYRSGLVDRKDIGPEIHLREEWKAAESRIIRSIWLPVKEALPGYVTNIYVCPGGLIGNISFGALQYHDQFLLEKFDFIYLFSPRDLLGSKPPMPGVEAVLIGDPDFNRGSTSGSGAGEKLKRTIPYRPLPSSAEEIGAISNVFGRFSRVPPKVYMGSRASEEVMWQLKHPWMIHVASHGGRLPLGSSESRNQDVGELLVTRDLLNNGIALAGANPTLELWAQGKIPNPRQDGILTADEIVQLDLEGTSLVYLSACSLGESVSLVGEELFGVRRAFAIAGVRHLILAAWPVYDKLATDFLTDFYTQALADPSNLEGVFCSAQRQFSRKYSPGEVRHIFAQFMMSVGH